MTDVGLTWAETEKFWVNKGWARDRGDGPYRASVAYGLRPLDAEIRWVLCQSPGFGFWPRLTLKDRHDATPPTAGLASTRGLELRLGFTLAEKLLAGNPAEVLNPNNPVGQAVQKVFGAGPAVEPAAPRVEASSWAVDSSDVVWSGPFPRLSDRAADLFGQTDAEGRKVSWHTFNWRVRAHRWWGVQGPGGFQSSYGPETLRAEVGPGGFVERFCLQTDPDGGEIATLTPAQAAVLLVTGPRLFAHPGPYGGPTVSGTPPSLYLGRTATNRDLRFYVAKDFPEVSSCWEHWEPWTGVDDRHRYYAPLRGDRGLFLDWKGEKLEEFVLTVAPLRCNTLLERYGRTHVHITVEEGFRLLQSDRIQELF